MILEANNERMDTYGMDYWRALDVRIASEFLKTEINKDPDLKAGTLSLLECIQRYEKLRSENEDNVPQPLHIFVDATGAEERWSNVNVKGWNQVPTAESVRREFYDGIRRINEYGMFKLHLIITVDDDDASSIALPDICYELGINPEQVIISHRDAAQKKTEGAANMPPDKGESEFKRTVTVGHSSRITKIVEDVAREEGIPESYICCIDNYEEGLRRHSGELIISRDLFHFDYGADDIGITMLSMCIDENKTACLAELVARYATARSMPFSAVAREIANHNNRFGLNQHVWSTTDSGGKCVDLVPWYPTKLEVVVPPRKKKKKAIAEAS